jgi:hypothetical protein
LCTKEEGAKIQKEKFDTPSNEKADGVMGCYALLQVGHVWTAVAVGQEVKNQQVSINISQGRVLEKLAERIEYLLST